MKLRDYQETVINNCRKQFASGHKNLLVVAPVGSGKTVIASFMMKHAKEKGLTVWFVVHKRELILQAHKAISAVGLSAGIVSNGFPLHPREQIQVVGLGSLRSRRNKIKTPDIIIYDECHHMGAKTWVSLHKEFSDLGKFQIGLTATPWRLDRVGLGRYFSVMIEAPDISELIKMGNLSKFKAYARELADPSGVKTTMGDYDLKDFEKSLSQTFTSDVITEYKRHLYNKRAVLFASSVEQAIRFANEFNSQGIPAAYIDGEMENRERDLIVKKLETGEIKVLTNYAIVTEGFDVPAIEGVIFTRPTMSLSLYIQMAGRALRPHADKSHAVILDHVGNIVKHGLVDDKREWQLTDRAKKSKDKNKEISVKTCKKCFAANRSFNRYCDNCGEQFEVKKSKEIEIDNSNLVEVDRQKLLKVRKREQAEAKTLEDLVLLAKKRNYKNPTFWAQTIFNSRRRK